jgi:hypothetical protein
MTCVECDVARSHHDCPLCDGHLCAACCRKATAAVEAELATVDAAPMTDAEIEDVMRYVPNRKWQMEAKR